MKICSKISTMTEGNADRHQMVLGDGGEVIGRLGDAGVAKRAELELNDKIEARFAEKGGAYIDPVHMVMDDPKNAGLKQAYAGFTQDRYAIERAEPDHDMAALDAGAEIDTRVKAYVHDHPEMAYRGAMGFVLGADPELKATYEQAA